MLIVGIGGTERENSSSETALYASLRYLAQRDALTKVLNGPVLAELPMYRPGVVERSPIAQDFVESVRRCDGLIISSPGYHGSVSGLVKNALDYIEDLRDDRRPYLSDRAVGCIAVSCGWQAAVTTLEGLRSISHALRGWVTPLGTAVNSKDVKFDSDGTCSDDKIAMQLELVSRQVADFADAWRSLART